ncbi:MAG: BamA/TamA family outer membrane protein, partial [Sphingomonadaceae bacterium]
IALQRHHEAMAVDDAGRRRHQRRDDIQRRLQFACSNPLQLDELADAASERRVDLVGSSAEARYRFGDFGVVGFVDAGAVGEGSLPTLSGSRFGVGVGGRYFTSFGPIRVDVARAINRSPRDPPIALYISIGQAF